MANYDIRPLQLHILNILLAVDRVCHDHQLRYYLWAGTMLGAIRHKGFIPWDDDMDICMPRPDYDLFMQHAAEWLPQPYEAVCAETDPRYPGPFGKVQDSSTTLIERAHINYIGGLYIDVFPLDGVPSNRLLQRLNFARYELQKRLIYFLHRDPYKHGKGPSSWLPLLCQKLTSNAAVQRRLRLIMLRYSYASHQLIADYDDGLNGVCDKAVLGQPTPVEFEGKTVMGVEHADEYLRRKYGDYMTIPDGDHQRQHNFYYLDYQLPYRQYHDSRQFK
jgi:lipopolysaccharide cholinephosphotransferase